MPQLFHLSPVAAYKHRMVLDFYPTRPVDPLEVLIDGNLTPHGRRPEWRWAARPIVGGDAIEPCISAASIIAKEHRDALMKQAALEHHAVGQAAPDGPRAAGVAERYGDATQIRAFDGNAGTVTEIRVEVGQAVRAGEVLAVVADQ